MLLRALSAVATAAVLATPLVAQTGAATRDHDPLFLGYGSEPGMDLAGRTVAALDAAVGRAFSAIGEVGQAHPGVQPAWEFPLGAAFLLLQHEVGGHGGRAREFGLGPSYSFSLDFSGATSTADPPRTNLQGTLLAAGGTEADGVLAHGVLLDALRPEGVDGAKLPLLLMTKLDLTLYVAQVDNPDGRTFVQQYRDGNDMAYWLVSRQAARRAADPAAVWNGDYEPDLADGALRRDWRAARATALWNALDPSLAAALVGYFRQHVLGGAVRVQAPVLRLGDGVGLLIGTRGALGPREVTRFLDLYLVAREVVIDAYARDLDSGVERTWGGGVKVRGVPLGGPLRLAAGVDSWNEPRAPEGPAQRSAWNAVVEVEARIGERAGLLAQIGRKSRGFLPGLPQDAGGYLGFGVSARF